MRVFCVFKNVSDHPKECIEEQLIAIFEEEEKAKKFKSQQKRLDLIIEMWSVQ